MLNLRLNTSILIEINLKFQFIFFNVLKTLQFKGKYKHLDCSAEKPILKQGNGDILKRIKQL